MAGWTCTSSGVARSSALLALLMALLSLAVPARAEAAGEGQVRFMLHATSTHDMVLTGSTMAERQWMRDHYWRMRGYAPFFTQRALSWAPSTHVYKDLLAVYNRPGDDGLGLAADHPGWVLRDASGERLYLNYGCSGGTCPQFIADPGNPHFRAWWIDRVRSDIAAGYAGVHVDDVNMEMTVSDGTGTSRTPIDPRTGKPMTEADWRRYIAEFVEEIDAALPDAEIAHNQLWWASKQDRFVRRQIDAADMIELERGFNDAGIGGGSGPWGYETYLAHIDWLHARGKTVIYEPKGLDDRSARFEVGSFLLVNDGADAITTEGYHETPRDWWRGWETNLGDATGPRYAWQGLLRRDFSGGTVLVNPPESAPVAVDLGASQSLTLIGRDALVLRSTEALALPQPATRLTLKASRKRIRRGHRITLHGTAPRARGVALKVHRGGQWRLIERTAARTNGRFRVRLRARGGPTLRFRALSGSKRSRVVRVRVRTRG